MIGSNERRVHIQKAEGIICRNDVVVVAGVDGKDVAF
jgi:hypothetical protein